MSRRNVTRTTTVAVLGLLALALPVLTAGSASAHGYTNSPVSRAYHCAQGTVQNCGQIQWEPQSVEGPKGFPASGPADGTICSAGLGQFRELDDPRGGGWPTTGLTPGGSFTFTWHLTARHATTSFRYFVTKDGYDPSQPLTRAALEPAPFLTVDGGGEQPPSDVAHTGTLPNKSGRHMILSVWDIADTANAFYQCADVTFG
jgi:predicted carbohydrate-binding protein with CBM5 and CBM33 domain